MKVPWWFRAETDRKLPWETPCQEIVRTWTTGGSGSSAAVAEVVAIAVTMAVAVAVATVDVENREENPRDAVREPVKPELDVRLEINKEWLLFKGLFARRFEKKSVTLFKITLLLQERRKVFLTLLSYNYILFWSIYLIITFNTRRLYIIFKNINVC